MAPTSVGTFTGKSQALMQLPGNPSYTAVNMSSSAWHTVDVWGSERKKMSLMALVP